MVFYKFQTKHGKRNCMQVFQEKLCLECHIEIESPISNNPNNGNNPRIIICNLLRNKDKLKILQKAKNLRGTNIFINEDVSRETIEQHKQLRKEVKAYRDKGSLS